jgi:hypothetical protein
MLRFDHVAVSAKTLAEGVEMVEAALGMPLAGGGKHPHMATHNRLIGMGDLYLEVIAIDPEPAAPVWPRWFDLDRFSGPPRITNWVAGSDDLEADLRACPQGTGVPVALQRGDFRWKMAVPPDGKLPFMGAFPALIQWTGPLHPAQVLPDQGLRLTHLEIALPDALGLQAVLSPLFQDPRVHVTTGAVLAMRATFTTPHGQRVIE